MKIYTHFSCPWLFHQWAMQENERRFSTCSHGTSSTPNVQNKVWNNKGKVSIRQLPLVLFVGYSDKLTTILTVENTHLTMGQGCNYMCARVTSTTRDPTVLGSIRVCFLLHMDLWSIQWQFKVPLKDILWNEPRSYQLVSKYHLIKPNNKTIKVSHERR